MPFSYKEKLLVAQQASHTLRHNRQEWEDAAEARYRHLAAAYRKSHAQLEYFARNVKWMGEDDLPPMPDLDLGNVARGKCDVMAAGVVAAVDFLVSASLVMSEEFNTLIPLIDATYSAAEAARNSCQISIAETPFAGSSLSENGDDSDSSDDEEVLATPSKTVAPPKTPAQAKPPANAPPSPPASQNGKQTQSGGKK